LLTLFVLVGVVASAALPNAAAGLAANESSAVYHLLTLKEAELKFKATTGKGRFGTMRELKEEKLLDAELAGGLKDGYGFNVTTTSETFEVRAVPAKYPADGRRSFYFSLEDGIIRAADKQGMAADVNDPPLPESERVAATPKQTR
jgi:alanyl-tRNA synthetase